MQRVAELTADAESREAEMQVHEGTGMGILRVEIEGLCTELMRARMTRDSVFAGAERALL